MSKDCDVCGGEGAYPIIDRYGKERHLITCPECYGSGLCETDEEIAARIFAAEQRRKYDAIMAEKRATEGRQP